MLKVKVVVLGLDKGLNLLLDWLRDFIDGATSVTMNHEPIPSYDSDSRTFNGSSWFLQLRGTIDSNFAINDFAVSTVNWDLESI